MSAGLPPDDAWLPVLGRRARRTPAVLDREPLGGGYASAAVQRVDLDDGRSVVLKAAQAGEVAALRAIGVVPGVDRPRMLASGPGWGALEHYPGTPAAPGRPVPSPG